MSTQIRNRGFCDPPSGFDAEVIQPVESIKGCYRVRSLAIDVAGRCNLACRYCAEAATQPVQRQTATDDIIDAAWAFIYHKGKFPKTASFHFGSGEPLMGLSALKRLSEHIEEMDGANEGFLPRVFITTNGTMLKDSVMEWLISTDWHIKVSLDGPRSIHDKWRITPNGEGTYDCVSRAVASMAARIPDRFSVTAVLAPGNDPREVFDAIANLGVRRIELVPLAHKDECFTPNATDLENYSIFIEDYVKRILDREAGLPILVRFINRVTRIMGFDNNSVQCGAGRTFLGVDGRGNLYPCFRFIGVKKYLLGDLFSGLDQKATDHFRKDPGRPYHERTSCKECWAAPLCGGPCFAVAEMFGSGMGEPYSLYCDYVLIESHGAFQLVSKLRKMDPEYLLTYLPGELPLEI